MSKFISFFSALVLVAVGVGCATNNASSVSMPQWVCNYHDVYPETKYIAQLGTGSHQDESKNKAISEISYYMSTEVNSRRVVNYNSFELQNNDKTSIETSRSIENNTAVTTDTKLTALECTEPYFEHKSKTWYCVAFIDREKAWKQYEPTMRVARDTFNELYLKAQEESEPVLRIRYYGAALESGKKFSDTLSYGELLSDTLTNTAFSGDMAHLSKIKSLQKQEMLKNPVFIKMSADSGTIIYNAVSKGFSDSGFILTKNRSAAAYVADVCVNYNEIKDDDFFISVPSIIIQLIGKKATVYSFTCEGQKTKAFSRAKVEEKASLMLADSINEQLASDFCNTLAGKK